MINVDKILAGFTFADESGWANNPMPTLEALKKLLPTDLNATQLALDPANDPQPEDSIGTLVNKLSYSTVQMFHNQEVMYKIRRQTTDQFIADYAHKLDELHITIKRSCDLNVQRARLVDAIDKKAYALGQMNSKPGQIG